MSRTTEHAPEDLLQTAGELADQGNYKAAYNLLARGPWQGGPEDQEYRYRRGVYAYRVAHDRLNQFERSPHAKTTLIKAGCWLARSDAYLTSATEGAPDAERAGIEGEVERTKREEDRFRDLCREYAVDLFVSKDDIVSED